MKRSRILKTAIVVLTAIAMFGCGSKTAEKKGKGEVLVEVNGSTITSEDLTQQIEMLPPQVKAFAQTPQGRRELLDSLVAQQLVFEEAKKAGIENSQEYKERLADIQKRLMVESYVKKTLAEKVKIEDAELRKFYDENKEKFKAGNPIKASHILVKDEKLAQDIFAQLKKGGNFEELAKKYSTDGAKEKGGDLGWFSKDAMIPEFYAAAEKLKEGEVSNIVKTQFGFHIIKLTGKRAAGILPFEEIKEQLKEMLLPQKQQEYFNKMKTDLMSKAKIQIKDKSLESAPAAANPPAGMPVAPAQQKK